MVSALGGKENIVAVTHCSDAPALRSERRKPYRRRASEKHQRRARRGAQRQSVPGIIGNTVSQAYREVVSLLPANSATCRSGRSTEAYAAPDWRRILDALIGTMSPLIPAIIGGSMVKLLAMILEMTGVLGKGDPTLTILTVIGDGAFFFLPLMVAASAAVKFKTNMSLAIAIAGVLVHPSFIELMAKAAQGEHVEFALIPVTAVKYTYTVIPALAMTWCLSYIERWVDRITPAVTKNFLKPMLIVLIAAPLAIVLIGPLGIWIGSAISALVYTIHGYLGWLSVAIMGALWPLLVMTGMHRVFTPTIIQTIAETGKEGMVMPSEIGANLSLGGSSLAVAWKTKNPELRQTALAAAASAIMAGISEPALYGVAVRLKRPLIASLISGFICGAVAGMAGLASHSMAAPGLFTSVQFFDPANPMTIVWVFGVMGLAVVLPFVLTLLLGLEDIPVEDEAEKARALQTAPVQNKAAEA
ncbi:PTS cellobiose/arbutin/salicin transporter subunit IIBC [Enterobacter hormaechei]